MNKRYVVNGMVKTQFNREIPAPPAIRLDTDRKVVIDLKKLDNWLTKNAKEEAFIRKDKYNQTIFNGIKEGSKLTTSDKEGINLYLFREEYPVFYKGKTNENKNIYL